VVVVVVVVAAAALALHICSAARPFPRSQPVALSSAIVHYILRIEIDKAVGHHFRYVPIVLTPPFSERESNAFFQYIFPTFGRSVACRTSNTRERPSP
jgi:hypothetical protein